MSEAYPEDRRRTTRRSHPEVFDAALRMQEWCDRHEIELDEDAGVELIGMLKAKSNCEFDKPKPRPFLVDVFDDRSTRHRRYRVEATCEMDARIMAFMLDGGHLGIRKEVLDHMSDMASLDDDCDTEKFIGLYWSMQDEVDANGWSDPCTEHNDAEGWQGLWALVQMWTNVVSKGNPTE